MDESAIPPLLGIIGHEIAGNPTQFAMERVIAAAGLEWRFLSFAVAPERLEEAVRGIDALGFRGLAVAPSHSEVVSSLLTEKAPSCELSNWTDVIVRGSDGQLVGHNVIAQALVDWLGKENLADGTAVVLGNTSKSLAMARLLLGQGLRDVLLRDAKPPADDDRFRTGNLAGEDCASCRILIRASVTDDKIDAASITESQLDQLPAECAVVDLATCAGTSPMLRYAASRGLTVLSAIDLMVIRSSTAFQMWTGMEADLALLREAFEEYLEI